MTYDLQRAVEQIRELENEWMSCWQCPWVIALGWKACINCSANRQMNEVLPFLPLEPGRTEVTVEEES